MAPQVRPPTAVGQRALRDAAVRAAAMLGSVSDPTVPVPGLEWNAYETAAHLVAEIEDYAGFVAGERDAKDVLARPSTGSTPSQLSAVSNARQVGERAGSDIGQLAHQLVPAVERFMAAGSDRFDGEHILTSNGLSMSVPLMTSTLLGEVLIHGFDIARATRRPWPISSQDALQVIGGVMTMVPDYLDREKTAGLHLSYELRFRGGPRYRLAIDDGAAEVTEAGPKVDCWISADPVAFLLVGYQRIGQWGQTLRGKMMAGGSKPWLGFRFGGLLTGP
ncbi:MAG TPA: maleylpyruvate isomerase N-terminal domain-containing protein [Acidimicrobiales bacterium]|nr:maleylpyruvate isomerase N-terminal domain-containing protein [Acidimicrobiales bacterium]